LFEYLTIGKNEIFAISCFLSLLESSQNYSGKIFLIENLFENKVGKKGQQGQSQETNPFFSNYKTTPLPKTVPKVGFEFPSKSL
jgi:hypothetical protein